MVAALLVFPFLNLPSSAQTNAPQDLSSRYLFIVDTSAAMRRCASAAQKAVGNLLRSSLSAQLRAGDTVGVWTFDEELYAGRFPLQRWSPELTESVASNVVAFLRTQPFQKQSRFEVVAPALERIVRDSKKLTVILVTDGDERITSTPFDREIQSVLGRDFKKQQKARMPFITVLRASRGRIINASVNLAPWPVEFPAFPPEPEIVEAPKPKPPEKQPEPRPAVPPLIVIGKKPEPPAATNTPAATTVITAAPPTAATHAPAITNTLLAAPAPPTTNAPATAEPTAPLITPAAPQLTPAEIKPAPAPTPTPALVEVVTEPAQRPPPSQPPAATPVPPASTPTVETRPAPPPANTQPSEPTQSSPAPTPVVMAPVAPVAPEPLVTDAPTNQTTTNPPPPIALAVQPEPGFSRLGLVGIGVAVMLVAGGFLFVMQRRTRNATQPSLITRSLERDHK